ncbi:MAG: nitroreductase family protein [Burkholderiales bacterium]|nr:nitroreductase family protein [Burkholderiales bacterium]
MDPEWRIEEAEFPRDGTLGERIRFALRYAILAPSSHNSQPWRFRVENDTVSLLADRTRALPVVDPHDRELTISCGAALFNLLAGIAHHGMAATPDLLPTGAEPDLIARVRVADAPVADAEIARLAAAVPLRRTNRGAYGPIAVPDKTCDLLGAAARAEGVAAHMVADLEMRKRVAALVARADHAQFADPRFRRELAAWIHPARERDGMAAHALGVPRLLDFETRITAMVIRTFDLGDGVAASDAELVAGSPLLLCLSTPRDDPPAWVQTGLALERVLLTARLEGYDASYLNQPIEVPELRPELRNLLGTAPYPQILLRVGRGSAAAPAPRRGLGEVAL